MGRFTIGINTDLFRATAEAAQWGVPVYGSLTTRGLLTMVQTIRSLLPRHIEGLDFGCGDGELVYHLQEQLGGSWYGVEICGSRVDKQRRPVFIWEGDMLEEPLHSYTVLHADNLCLEEAVAERLEAKIAAEFEGLYITYRTPTALPFLRKARYLKTVPTETTWTVHPIHYWWVPKN